MNIQKMLAAGDMIYSTISRAVRGADAIGLDVPSVTRWRSNAIGGAGTVAGMYGRTQPYIANAALVMVLQDVNGVGQTGSTVGMAGHLIKPSALWVATPDGL